MSALAVFGARPAGDGDADVSLCAAVRRRFLEVADLGGLGVPTPEALHDRLSVLLREQAPLLPRARFAALLERLAHEVLGLGPIEPLLADPTVTEVMINAGRDVYVERAGGIEHTGIQLESAEVIRIVERVIAPLGLRLDRSSPMVDARLPDGSRLHAVLPPLAIDGPTVTIRRFGARRVTLADFGAGATSIAFLNWMVRAGWNVLVAGGTGSGKTTLLNALSTAIPADERIVTIEETAELRLAQPHRVRLEARPANGEGAGGVSVRDLVRGALRMRPDRLVVGEVRGGEALDMLQAMNTGHDGSLCTLHANGAAEALTRLETLTLFADVGLPLDAIRAQITAAVDAVIYVKRRSGGERRIETIAELSDTAGSGMRVLFEADAESGLLSPLLVPTRRTRRHDAPQLDESWFTP